MSVVVVEPSAPVVTLQEMERHLADLPDEDQQYVSLLIAAATAWIDGPAGWLGRAIGPQLLEYRDDEPCSSLVALPFGPVIEIETAWIDGETVNLDDPNLLGPIMMPGSGRYRIRYWAGYGRRDPDDEAHWISLAPPPIKVAIMMLVAQWYNVRENVITGTITSEMPFAVDALLQPYRVYR